MVICILGRQPALGLAELEQIFGAQNVRPVGVQYALVNADVDIARLGGSIKVAKLLSTQATTNPQKLFDYCRKELPKHLQYVPEGKIKLGVSVYGLDMPVQKINANMLSLKKTVKAAGRSVRVVPNTTPELSSAQTYHNSLTGELGMELVFVRDGQQTLLGQVVGVQDINAYTQRDQARPKRDAFVGMLPPKLAQMMVNMASVTNIAFSPAEQLSQPFAQGTKSEEQPDALLPGAKSAPARNGILGKTVAEDARTHKQTVLDPFCGTGVVLQEAALLGFDVYGTDLSEKMVDYSGINMQWLIEKYGLTTAIELKEDDAMDATWHQPIHAVVAETYLGQPFSAPPSPAKLTEVRGNCNHIISTFLKNLAPQIQAGTQLCLAVPAWRSKTGQLTHLPLVNNLAALGYEWQPLEHVRPADLVYYREDQVVARQLLILRKAP